MCSVQWSAAAVLVVVSAGQNCSEERAGEKISSSASLLGCRTIPRQQHHGVPCASSSCSRLHWDARGARRQQCCSASRHATTSADKEQCPHRRQHCQFDPPALHKRVQKNGELTSAFAACGPGRRGNAIHSGTCCATPGSYSKFHIEHYVPSAQLGRSPAAPCAYWSLPLRRQCLHHWMSPPHPRTHPHHRLSRMVRLCVPDLDPRRGERGPPGA